MSATPMLDWALWYHARGMHVMPIEPHGKRPILESWTQYQTTQPTRDEITRWWTETPNANIGLIQGRGQFVLDIDGPVGEQGLVDAGIEIPKDAPMVKTANGRHIYFQGVAPQRAKAIPKVDTRSDGGYVVAPPSIHESGHQYVWTNDMWPPPQAPEKLLTFLSKHKASEPAPGEKPHALVWVTDALRGVSKGERHDMCVRLGGYLWNEGLPLEVIEGLLQNWAARCDPPFEPDEVRKNVLSLVKMEGGPTEQPSGIREIVAETLRQVFAPKESRPPVASTSLGFLDEMLDGGFYPGDYILMASRPSVGKSALALQIARASARRGAGVMVASLEMSKTALTRRMLVQHSGLPSRMLKTGEGFDPFSTTALMAAGEELSNMPIWITTDVRSGEDLHEALSTYEKGVLKLVVLDYLQIMSADGRDGRARVEHCSKLVRAAAIKFNVPILCLSSLSRPPRDLDTWRPELRDLRESGELEHDADIVLMLHRELVSEHTEIFVRKNRDGQAGGMVRALFDGQRQTFREGKQ